MNDKTDGSIRLLNAGLSEVNGEIIAQGFLGIDSMMKLKVDDYQREFLSRIGSARKSHIETAITNGVRLPAIVVGMRGERFNERGDTMFLDDPCYIVDGLQRIFTLRQYAEKHPDEAAGLRIGAEIRFGTTKESEKELFHALNAFRTSMSGNVILRNMRQDNRAILTLYGLSMSDPTSPLYRRVQWNQRMNRGELLTAIMICHVANIMHASGDLGERGNPQRLAGSLEAKAERVGLRQFRDNVNAFFALMDECFHISKIEFREKATAIKGNFMLSVARLLASHQNFWNGDKLVVSADHKRKLATFPYDDPEIMRLSSAGTMALPILYNLMCDHMNKGKRINKLHPRAVPEGRVVRMKRQKDAA